jgi:3-oxoacyl-[acyl-carrier-protein] synthase I
VPKNLAQALLPTLDTWPYPLHGVEAHFGGHACGVKAIEAAARVCAEEPRSIALVLAVDTLVGPETLTWLEKRDLLHGAQKIYEGRPTANAYGRLPGEGAAALVLSHRRDLPTWSHITGLAWGEEPRTFDQDQPCIGQGLTKVAQQALDQAAEYRQHPIRHLSHDYNGEPYRADEYGFTALRLADRLALDHARHTPALVSGDLGSASAIAHTALAAWASQQCPGGADHLILASGDDPLRGALVLYADNKEGV